jgi:hypothetical protein
MVKPNAWIAVSCLAVSFAAFFCSGCGEQKVVGKEVERQIAKTFDDRAAKAAGPDRAHPPDQPRAQLHESPAPGNQAVPAPAPFGLGAVAGDNELTSRIQSRVTSCAGTAAKDVLQDMVSDSVKAALEARDKKDATTESIQKAAGDAAVTAAGKAGVSLPIGFLKCVTLEPIARAY